MVYISVLAPVALGRALHMAGKSIFIGAIINVVTIITVEILSLSLSPKAVIYPILGCLIMLVVDLFRNYKHLKKI